MQSRAARTARGWITGAFATAAAAVSHGVADGAAPSALALVAALVFAGVLGTFVVGRRASLPRLVTIVASSQLAFHLVFSTLTPGSATAGGHHGGAAMLEPGVTDYVVVEHATGMWAAHAVAMVATIVFLRRAELALWSLLREALATAAGVPAIDAVPSVPRADASTAPRHPISSVFLTVLSDRGPPAVAGA